MSKTNNKNEVKVSTENNESFSVANVKALSEVMTGDECQGLQFTFDRAIVPSGGSTAFQIPSENSEEPEMVKEIVGVILLNHTSNTYYKEKYTGQQVPPDCYSIDGIEGVGNPGGSCKDCPFNQYGSGENNSKACKNKRMLYIMVQNEMFPITLNLPTGSLKSFTQYVKFNFSKGRKLSRIVTKITLRKATNSTGIAYSQCVFTYIRDLTNEEITSLAPIVDIVKEYSLTRLPSVVKEQDDNIEDVFVDKETGEKVIPLK